MKTKTCLYPQPNSLIPRTAIEREQKQFIQIAFAVHLSAAISAERYRSDSVALKRAVFNFVFFVMLKNKIEQSAKTKLLLNSPTDMPFGNRWSRYKEPSKNKAEAYRVYVEHLFLRSDAGDARIFSKEETGLYYYGARYLDPKYSRWLSGDPALNDYIPKAPIDDEAKKHNENLPGMGGVFNTVNLHVYHYAGNNPVKYTDPDGESVVVVTAVVVWGVNALLLMIGVHHVASSNKGDKLYQQIANGNTKEFSSTDLYDLYKSGRGRNVTLSQVGLSSKIQKAVASNPALTKNKGSVQSRFINQLKSGGADEKFERTYDFGSVVFAIGGATVSGQFDGTVTKNENGTTHIEGTITYSFHDTFTDPYDTFNVTTGEFNPDGKPYEITETWTVKINGDY